MNYNLEVIQDAPNTIEVTTGGYQGPPGIVGPIGPVGPVGPVGPPAEVVPISALLPHLGPAVDTAIGTLFDLATVYQLST